RAGSLPETRRVVKMPLLLLDHNLRGGHVACEPFSVLPGNDHVGRAVADPSRNADLGNVVAPCVEEGKVVFDPSPDSVAKLFARRLPDDVVTLLPSGFGAVRRRQLPFVADYLGGVGRDAFECFSRLPFEFWHEHALAFERPPKPLDVGRIHSGEEVEALGVIGRKPDYASGSRHPVRQARSDCERVWTATRTAYDGKVLDPEVIGERTDILDAVDDASAPMPVGSSVARAVVGDDSRSCVFVDALVVMPAQARPRGSVEREDGEAVGVAPFGVCQRSPVASPRMGFRQHAGSLRLPLRRPRVAEVREGGAAMARAVHHGALAPATTLRASRRRARALLTRRRESRRSSAARTPKLSALYVDRPVVVAAERATDVCAVRPKVE